MQAGLLPILKGRNASESSGPAKCSLDLIMYVINYGCTEHELNIPIFLISSLVYTRRNAAVNGSYVRSCLRALQLSQGTA